MGSQSSTSSPPPASRWRATTSSSTTPRASPPARVVDGSLGSATRTATRRHRSRHLRTITATTTDGHLSGDRGGTRAVRGDGPSRRWTGCRTIWAGLMNNVAVTVEHDRGGRGACWGCTRASRCRSAAAHYAGVMPDRITIYRRAISAICNSEGGGGGAGTPDRDPRDRPPLRHRRRPAPPARLVTTGNVRKDEGKEAPARGIDVTICRCRASRRTTLRRGTAFPQPSDPTAPWSGRSRG